MLKLVDVTKIFHRGTVNERKALDHLNLQADDGDFITIIGTNGSGKSTAFGAVCGSFYVDEGYIELDGENITFVPEYRRSRDIGHLFQDPMKGTAPHLSIEENLAIAWLRASRGRHACLSRTGKKDRRYFREVLSQLGMGLEDRMKSPVGLLSGGQRQALTLLMATLVTPRILLLDEHTAALDPGTADKVLDLTGRIVAERNITCMMITHNMKHALALGNRTLMMDGGRIVLDVAGKEREGMNAQDLLLRFAPRGESRADSDRIPVPAQF